MQEIRNTDELLSLMRSEKLYIYGAGTICSIILELCGMNDILTNISGILVSKSTDNPVMMNEIPVMEYCDEFSDEKILVALSPKHTREVLQSLKVRKEIIVLSDNMEEQINKAIRDIENCALQQKRRYLEECIITMGKNAKKEDIDVMLLIPPYWDIYAPFSATACLTASLGEKGYMTYQNDIGIRCFRNALRKNWKIVSEHFISKNYYLDMVKNYEKNTYLTYEDYVSSLWFFFSDTFDIDKVKQKYRTMSFVQRRVIDEFYHRINDIDTVDINFDDKDISIHESVEKYAHINLLETLLDDSTKSIFEKKPKILGFSVTSSFQFLAACEMALLFRQILPETKLLFGGSCADLFIRSTYSCKTDVYEYFDYVLIGEGETALNYLIAYVNGECTIEDVPNLVRIKDDNEVMYMNVIVEDVVSLPTPKYDDLDLSLYMAPEIILPYQSSRGCHYGYCAFCNHDEKYRHNYRSKQMERVIEDILKLHHKYNVNYFQFVDEAIRPDCFKLMIDEMDKYDEFKKIKWFYYSRVSMEYNSELLDKAKRNGCDMVMFGIESFNQRLLKFVKKGINVNTSRYCLRLFHSHGIKTYAWLMSGLPSETLDEAKADFEDLKNEISNIDSFSIGIFFLSKNTDMYINPEKYNITRINEDNPYDFDSHFEGDKIDRDKMMNFVRDEYSAYQREKQMYDNRYTVFFE